MARLDPAKVPQRILLVGERSSGKSTELTKLAAELAENYNALIVCLALIHYQGTRLPHRRVELYRLSVQALAETWNLARSLSGRPIDLWLDREPLDERRVVHILAPIAFWMHEEVPGGLVERSVLEARLAQHFVENEGQTPGKAAELARDFLDLIREQSGLLVERGLDLYGFMHLTYLFTA